ncbi:hypothetical protein SmJEL517_g02913 [Synchytrium microbalum]|uniref:Fcf2 pre-rRNA processing C-terminal domain-containing protein n=1 Tax=Synchytrium microbalum TaxID=1806994 RepID=A0A507C462_9FUNG|nr:uncharacterized protein SmJEL517_g02913 [Synchytrium microbalum]TPX34452.1 hypothetical protein SmJEL517_g02913 [Synchytrium microbalum]
MTSMEMDDDWLQRSMVALQERRNTKSSSAVKPVPELDVIQMPVQINSGIPTAHPYFDKDQHGVARIKTSKLNPSSAPTTQTTNIPFNVSQLPDSKTKSTTAGPETAGPKWFDMPATDITPEIKRDLQILKNRHVLDPKRFYKRQDKKTAKDLPKFFQIGTIVEGPAEFYSARIPRKQRKQNLVEELLQDAEKSQYLKKKFDEIQAKKADFTRRRRPQKKK